MLKIEKSIYTGYIWKSDLAEPQVLNNMEYELILNNSENPFIIEANLIDEKNKISYTIKYIDGEYKVYSYNLNLLNTNITKHEYLPSFKGVKSIKYIRVWRDVDDDENDLCCGMKTLQPQELIFNGLNF